MKKTLYWVPRILSILFTLFITVFTLDVFGQGYAGGEFVWALVMNLLPTIVVVIATIIAWKMERLGGWLFITLCAVFLLLNGVDDLVVFIFALPLGLIGGLYLWYHNKYIAPIPHTEPAKGA